MNDTINKVDKFKEKEFDFIHQVKQSIRNNNLEKFKQLIKTKNDIYPSLIIEICTCKSYNTIDFLIYCFYTLEFRYNDTDIFFGFLENFEDQNIFTFFIHYFSTIQKECLTTSLSIILQTYTNSNDELFINKEYKLVNWLKQRGIDLNNYINLEINKANKIHNNNINLSRLYEYFCIYSWTFETNYKLITFYDFGLATFLNKGKFNFIDILFVYNVPYNKTFVYESLKTIEPSVTNQIVEKCKTDYKWSYFLSQFEIECKQDNYPIHCINTIKELSKEYLLNTIQILVKDTFISYDCIDISKYFILHYI